MRPITLALLTCTLVPLVACQSTGSGTAPATPTAAPTLPPAIDLVQTGDLTTGTALAAWDLTVHQGELQLTPVRHSSAIGDNFLINGAFFFTVSPDPNALKINGFHFEPNGDLAVEWGIRHPFKSVAQGANRADLDVFDVRLAFRPHNSTPTAIGGADRTIYANLLTNADGYTPDLAQTLSDAAVLPYVILENGADTNRFAQGTDYQPLESHLDLTPASSINLRVFLLCQYGASATRFTRLTPTYFVPEYNMKSAWKLEAEETANSLTAGQTGALDLTLRAYDWNDSRGGATVDPSYPNDLNLSGIRAASDLASIEIFAPDLLASPLTLTTPDSGTGQFADPFLFATSLATPAAPAAGEYLALIKALDSRTPNDNANPTTTGIDPGTTGVLTYFPLDTYATYQLLSYTVAPGGPVNDPPVAVIASLPSPPVITTVQTISFDGTGSTDDSAIVTYEWDFDYQAGSPAFVDLGPTPAAQNYPSVGTYTVALRVTDDGVPALTDLETLEVTVNLPPVTDCAHKAVWSPLSGSGVKCDPNNTNQVTIAGGRYFRISNDGSTVVYSAGAGIGGSLYVWRQGTGSFLLRPQSDDPLTYGFRADEVDLTSDGSIAVYTNARAGANPAKDSFIQATTVGSTPLQLNPADGGTHEWPRISANGAKVVIYKRSASQLWSVDPSGANYLNISPASDGPASINEDATKVYVERTNNNLWSIDIDGSNPTLLYPVGDYFVVSADDSTLVYMGAYDNGRDVWVRNLDGSDTPVKVLDADVDGFSGWFVSVSCDGDWVGFGGLISGGGTYHRPSGLKYLSTTGSFATQLYDGVTVGTVGAF